ncbi:MAG: DUF86 domain-containing protein [Candidatus Desulfofervidus auxilii]|nr:DUF86 domain-containing protein [Candidatus Desulfofervidus auxilii]
MYERLITLERNIAELKNFKIEHTLEDVLSNKTKEWALRYGFLESIQIIIDIACHICAKYNLGSPNNYSECIELLRKFKYIDKTLEKKLIGMVGLRNILVHEYISVDTKLLYKLLDNIDDMNEFIKQIKDYI